MLNAAFTMKDETVKTTQNSIKYFDGLINCQAQK